MTNAAGSGDAVPDPNLDTPDVLGAGQTNEALSAASVALSAIGFLTLLRLADRRDRSPAKALGLFFATTTESTLGIALGVKAIRQSGPAARTSRGFLLAAAGTVLGVITSVLNVNWMRTKRRV